MIKYIVQFETFKSKILKIWSCNIVTPCSIFPESPTTLIHIPPCVDWWDWLTNEVMGFKLK